MNRNKNLELIQNLDKEVWIPCIQCQLDTCHKVLFVAKTSNENDEDDPFKEWDQYQIVQCKGCKSISFLKESQALPEFDENGKLINYQDFYPSRVTGRRTIKNIYELPPQVREIYQETLSALCNKQPILAGIGIRAIAETVCNQKKAMGKDLKERIDNLVDLGELTKSQAEFLHQLRFLGNEAAHEVEAHKEQTLSTAMDIAENLLQNVYIIPKAAERLKERKKKSE